MVSQSVSFGPRLRAALNDVLGGSAASVLTVTFGLSYALLIFAGPLAPYLSYGVAATFISSAVLAAVIALGSSLPFAIAGPESSTAAMTGILASSLVERMAAADPSAPLLAPVLITLGLASHRHRHRALRLRGDADGPRDPLCALPGGRRISRRDRLPDPVWRDPRHHRPAPSICDARPVRKSADAVRTGGGLRDGAGALSDLAPLPQLVWTAGHPDRRRDRRAYRVLVCRHLVGGGAGLGLDLSAAAECPLHAAVERERNQPLSLVRLAGPVRQR